MSAAFVTYSGKFAKKSIHFAFCYWSGEPGNEASLLHEFCTATHNAAEDWERGCLIPRSFTSVMEPSHSM